MFKKKDKIKLTINDVEIEGTINQVFKIAKKFNKLDQGLHNFAQQQQMQQRQLYPAQQQWNGSYPPSPNPPIQQQPQQPMRQHYQNYPYPQYNVPHVQHDIPVADEAISQAPKTTRNKVSKKPQEIPPQPVQPQQQQMQQMEQVPNELPDLNIPPKGKTKVQL